MDLARGYRDCWRIEPWKNQIQGMVCEIERETRARDLVGTISDENRLYENQHFLSGVVSCQGVLNIRNAYFCRFSSSRFSSDIVPFGLVGQGLELEFSSSRRLFCIENSRGFCSC